VRDEKAQLEKQLYDIEYLVGEKAKEIEVIKSGNMKERNLAEQ